MNRKILSFFCAAALLAVLVPAGVMAAKNPQRQIKEAKTENRTGRK